MRDEDVRTSCFLALAVLQAQFGEELPYDTALKQGFNFRGRRVPFLNYQKGIYRAAVQRGPAALSIQTSAKSPYDDEATADGFFYRTPGVYQTPEDGRAAWAHLDGSRARPPGPAITLPGASRVVTHSCRGLTPVSLKEVKLLDAAHIVGDLAEQGEPVVNNGLNLCTIHHRAFDRDLVGISPDFKVQVAPRLLEDDDGPMLDLLKGSHGVTIELPARRLARPDPERLAIRFEQFQLGAST